MCMTKPGVFEKVFQRYLPSTRLSRIYQAHRAVLFEHFMTGLFGEDVFEIYDLEMWSLVDCSKSVVRLAHHPVPKQRIGL